MNKIFKLFMLAVVVVSVAATTNLKSLLQPKSGQKKTSQIAN